MVIADFLTERPRTSFAKNEVLLRWVMDWLGVNRREEKRALAKRFPQVPIPARYRKVEGNVLYRGFKINDTLADRLWKNGSIRFRPDGLVSFSMNAGVAYEFSVGAENGVVVAVPVYQPDVLLVIPALLDDLAWLDAKDEADWRFNRSELNFFQREAEVLCRDSEHYRTVYLEECVKLETDGRLYNPKRMIAQKRA